MYSAYYVFKSSDVTFINFGWKIINLNIISNKDFLYIKNDSEVYIHTIVYLYILCSRTLQ